MTLNPIKTSGRTALSQLLSAIALFTAFGLVFSPVYAGGLADQEQTMQQVAFLSVPMAAGDKMSKRPTAPKQVAQCIGVEESCKPRRLRNSCCPGLTCSAVSDDYSGVKGAMWCVGSTEAD